MSQHFFDTFNQVTKNTEEFSQKKLFSSLFNPFVGTFKLSIVKFYKKNLDGKKAFFEKGFD